MLVDRFSHPDGALRLPRATRVLFAYEDTHRVYRDVIAAAVRALRPGVAVTSVSLRSLASEVKRLEPHLVISSRSAADPGGGTAWYRLSHEPDEPSEVCLCGLRSRSENPGLGELMAVVDEVEEAIRAGRPLGGC